MFPPLLFRVGVFHCTVALVLHASKCKVSARPCPGYSRSGTYSCCSWTRIPGNKFQYKHTCRTIAARRAQWSWNCYFACPQELLCSIEPWL